MLGWSYIVTCLCQGVRMNDSSSSIRVFLSISSVKSTISVIFDTLDDRVTICGEVRVALSYIFGPEPHLIERFFVAFLKFPPIVQSGSILFRKLDRERAGPWRRPLPLRGVIGWGAHVWPMTSPSCREWQKILQLFNLESTCKILRVGESTCSWMKNLLKYAVSVLFFYSIMCFTSYRRLIGLHWVFPVSSLVVETYVTDVCVILTAAYYGCKK